MATDGVYEEIDQARDRVEMISADVITLGETLVKLVDELDKLGENIAAHNFDPDSMPKNCPVCNLPVSYVSFGPETAAGDRTIYCLHGDYRLWFTALPTEDYPSDAEAMLRAWHDNTDKYLPVSVDRFNDGGDDPVPYRNLRSCSACDVVLDGEGFELSFKIDGDGVYEDWAHYCRKCATTIRDLLTEELEKPVLSPGEARAAALADGR